MNKIRKKKLKKAPKIIMIFVLQPEGAEKQQIGKWAADVEYDDEFLLVCSSLYAVGLKSTW